MHYYISIFSPLWYRVCSKYSSPKMWDPKFPPLVTFRDIEVPNNNTQWGNLIKSSRLIWPNRSCYFSSTSTRRWCASLFINSIYNNCSFAVLHFLFLFIILFKNQNCSKVHWIRYSNSMRSHDKCMTWIYFLSQYCTWNFEAAVFADFVVSCFFGDRSSYGSSLPFVRFHRGFLQLFQAVHCAVPHFCLLRGCR